MSSNMKIGYARVSTLEQNLDLSSRLSRRQMSENIPREDFCRDPQSSRVPTDARSDSRGRHCRSLETDRLARSTRDLLETVETIRGAGGKFQSLSEPWADTTSHAGKMIMTIFAGIAEFERDLIRERTGAGRKAANKRGVLFGRPPKLIPDQRQLARRLVSEGKSVREIASVFNVHAATIYRLAYSKTGMAN